MDESTNETMSKPILVINPTDAEPQPITIEPYGNRFWAVHEVEELVCVSVYKKGNRSAGPHPTKWPA
jgi:hypothetical protein